MKTLFNKKYALGKVAEEGREDFFNTPYGTLWLLHGEMRIALENGSIAEAKAAVDAFTILLRAKLESGHRNSIMLFSAIRVTEGSGAGKHPNRPSVCLATTDMEQLWKLLDSVPAEEWSNYSECPSNCRQMVGRATGRE